MVSKIDPLDTLFSKFIRLRAMSRTHGCERCGAWKEDYRQLQCAHLISRWHKSIRWDEDAALGLCGGCHMWIDHEAEEKSELLKSKLGQEKFDALSHRARQIGKIDKNAITIYYKAKLEAEELKKYWD